MNTGFEGLDDALGTEYQNSNATDKAAQTAKKLDALSKKKNSDITLEDKEYMAFEIKTMIEDSRRVLDILEQDLKIGAQPRSFEVYATLTKAVLDGVKELRELHNNIEQLKLSKEKLELKRTSTEMIAGQPNVSIKLTGPELFKMINDAKSNSELNRIDAEFEIVDKTPK